LWSRERGRFLVEEKSVTYAPTVAAVSLGSSAASPAPISVFAPEPEKLPGSRVEALAIARSDKRATSYIGKNATKDRVRLALQRGNIVHIAAHGSHNSQNPLFSRVTVEGSRNLDSNSTLAVHEIMGLSTQSPVVFLSGCETGVSSLGEGVFSVESDVASLSQAFLFAGASNVIATLWPVQDSEAAKIASDFYQGFKGQASASEALAAAQRNAIRRRSGLTWAAYTVSSAGTANTN
jgi:CHAT domain-containing protein